MESTLRPLVDLTCCLDDRFPERAYPVIAQGLNAKFLVGTMFAVIEESWTPLAYESLPIGPGRRLLGRPELKSI